MNVRNESEFKGFLIGSLGRLLTFDRVESHSTSPGIPDLHYSAGLEHKIQGGFIETKYIKRDGVAVLRNTQYRWFNDQLDQNMNPFLAWTDGMIWGLMNCKHVVSHHNLRFLLEWLVARSWVWNINGMRPLDWTQAYSFLNGAKNIDTCKD